MRLSAAAGPMGQPARNPHRPLRWNHPEAGMGFQCDQPTRGDHDLCLPVFMERHFPGIGNGFQPKHHYRQVNPIGVVGTDLVLPCKRNRHFVTRPVRVGPAL
ncbi:hypothetical protein G6F35_017360 [Rhizopus arrhizus]|nr:hypothetical protein G6F35_017360 [Rhizopus arrhizus]